MKSSPPEWGTNLLTPPNVLSHLAPAALKNCLIQQSAVRAESLSFQRAQASVSNMKVRTITCSLVLSAADFHEADEAKLAARFDEIALIFDKCSKVLNDQGHEVQTVRISTNSFETWLLPLLSTLPLETIVERFVNQLVRINCGLCAVGACSTRAGVELIPRILAMSERLSASVLFSGDRNDVSADCDLAVVAAGVALELVEKCGVLGNFRFCTSFNCKPGTPFFPAAYSAEADAPSSSSSAPPAPSLSLGLENGDVVFMAFFGAPNQKTASANLCDVLRQICLKLQSLLMPLCDEMGVVYLGIDASINPGLSVPDRYTLL
jgi:hypothetical protein